MKSGRPLPNHRTGRSLITVASSRDHRGARRDWRHAESAWEPCGQGGVEALPGAVTRRGALADDPSAPSGHAAWLRACVVGALGALIATAGGFTTRGRVKIGPVISVSPTSVGFANTVAGEFNYQMVTISNTGDADDYVSTAAPPEGTLFATFGGSSNFSVDPNDPTHNYRIPANGSCTFQWGFHPPHPGKFTGTGTLTFENSPSITLSFTGKGTKK